MASKETLKERYEKGRISEAMLKKYVQAGVISEEEYVEITKKDNKDSE